MKRGVTFLFLIVLSFSLFSSVYAEDICQYVPVDLRVDGQVTVTLNDNSFHFSGINNFDSYDLEPLMSSITSAVPSCGNAQLNPVTQGSSVTFRQPSSYQYTNENCYLSPGNCDITKALFCDALICGPKKEDIPKSNCIYYHVTKNVMRPVPSLTLNDDKLTCSSVFGTTCIPPTFLFGGRNNIYNSTFQEYSSAITEIPFPYSKIYSARDLYNSATVSLNDNVVSSNLVSGNYGNYGDQATVYSDPALIEVCAPPKDKCKTDVISVGGGTTNINTSLWDSATMILGAGMNDAHTSEYAIITIGSDFSKTVSITRGCGCSNDWCQCNLPEEPFPSSELGKDSVSVGVSLSSHAAGGVTLNYTYCGDVVPITSTLTDDELACNNKAGHISDDGDLCATDLLEANDFYNDDKHFISQAPNDVVKITKLKASDYPYQSIRVDTGECPPVGNCIENVKINFFSDKVNDQWYWFNCDDNNRASAGCCAFSNCFDDQNNFCVDNLNESGFNDLKQTRLDINNFKEKYAQFSNSKNRADFSGQFEKNMRFVSDIPQICIIDKDSNVVNPVQNSGNDVFVKIENIELGPNNLIHLYYNLSLLGDRTMTSNFTTEMRLTKPDAQTDTQEIPYSPSLMDCGSCSTEQLILSLDPSNVGDYSLNLIADSQDNISETNEHNNGDSIFFNWDGNSITLIDTLTPVDQSAGLTGNFAQDIVIRSGDEFEHLTIGVADWLSLIEKKSQYGDQTGYCSMDSQCYYYNYATSQGTCIDNFKSPSNVEDLVCNNGNWTSKTLFLYADMNHSVSSMPGFDSYIYACSSDYHSRTECVFNALDGDHYLYGVLDSQKLSPENFFNDKLQANFNIDCPAGNNYRQCSIKKKCNTFLNPDCDAQVNFDLFYMNYSNFSIYLFDKNNYVDFTKITSMDSSLNYVGKTIQGVHNSITNTCDSSSQGGFCVDQIPSTSNYGSRDMQVYKYVYNYTNSQEDYRYKFVNYDVNDDISIYFRPFILNLSNLLFNLGLDNSYFDQSLYSNYIYDGDVLSESIVNALVMGVNKGEITNSFKLLDSYNSGYLKYKNCFIDDDYNNSQYPKFSQSYDSRPNIQSIPLKAKENGCCQDSQCWNGFTCLSGFNKNEPYNLNSATKSKFRYDDFTDINYVCVDGYDWRKSSLKTNWDNSSRGYCFNDSQCWVDSSNLCLNDTQSYGEYICDNGSYISTTSQIALTLMNISDIGNQDYTLYCDHRLSSLNNISYAFTNINDNVVTSVCVLDYGSKTTFGFKANVDITNQIIENLNSEMDRTLYPNIPEFSCDTTSFPNDFSYHSCDNNNYVWYNKKLNSYIISRYGVNLNTQPFFLKKLYDSTIGKFLNVILNFFYPTVNNNDLTNYVTDKMNNARVLYVNKQQNAFLMSGFSYYDNDKSYFYGLVSSPNQQGDDRSNFLKKHLSESGFLTSDYIYDSQKGLYYMSYETKNNTLIYNYMHDLTARVR